MKTKPVLFACCLLALVLMLPGCSGCWKQPEPDLINPTKYLDVKNDGQEEIWELVSIKGETAGYRHTTISKLDREGETVYLMTQEDVIDGNRLGERMTGQIRTVVQQKRDGTFLRGKKIENLSGSPMVTVFLPDEEQGGFLRQASTVTIDPESGEEIPNADPISKNLPWQEGTIGPFGKLFSLWDKPMQPGETRTVNFFDLTLEQMVTTELTAGKVESLLYNNQEVNLLPVTEVTKIGDYSITAHLWVDVNGNIIKSSLSKPLPMEIVLTPESKVKSFVENAGKVNLNLYALVRVQGTISQARSARKVVFQMHRINTDDAAAKKFVDYFPVTAFQSVRGVDENTVEVTVTASSPEALDALHGSVVPQAAKETTVPEDLQPNEWVQSDSEKVTAFAAQATDRNYPIWEVVVDLERFVSRRMQRVDYTGSFASAAETAESMSGDSVGYALLLAAIARAKNIPARVVTGLVYTTTNMSEGVMVPHFWTEMYIDGHWHPFDATTSTGGADAARIVLARSNLTDESLSALVTNVLPMIGRLQVSIVTSE